jgi:hypothetical protein
MANYNPTRISSQPIKNIIHFKFRWENFSDSSEPDANRVPMVTAKKSIYYIWLKIEPRRAKAQLIPGLSGQPIGSDSTKIKTRNDLYHLGEGRRND